VRIRQALLWSFVIGGLAAGLAGASQIIGRPPAWSLYATLGNVVTLGFDGIGVALVGRNHPLGGILAAVLFGALQHGGRFMEYHAGVVSELVRAVNGLIVITLSIPELWAMLRRRLAR
jgi:simple sugar transport system permease protein